MKHYRIVRIAPLQYEAARADLFAKNPESWLQPYADQQETLFQNAYVYSDGFSRTMRLLGHESHEIVYDLENLQKTWAEEKGVQYVPDHWQHQIILAQIKHLRPDVVYFQDIFSLPRSVRKQLKALFPFIRLVVISRGALVGAPDELLNEFADADVLVVASPILLEKCTSVGLKAHLVYHGFDEAVLERVEKNHSGELSPKYDFTFVGSSGFGRDVWFRSRYWALVELIQRSPLELWVDEPIEEGILPQAKAEARRFLKNLLGRFSIGALKELSGLSCTPARARRIISEITVERQMANAALDLRLPIRTVREMFPRRCHAPVFGIDMYRVLRESKVTLNKNSAASLGTVGNMRLFEATGVGACLLTDAGTNMGDLFEEDSEVVTYSSVDECVEKVGYLLGHDTVRRQIAAAGQARTLRDHTVLNRCQQIDDILQRML